MQEPKMSGAMLEKAIFFLSVKRAHSTTTDSVKVRQPLFNLLSKIYFIA